MVDGFLSIRVFCRLFYFFSRWVFQIEIAINMFLYSLRSNDNHRIVLFLPDAFHPFSFQFALRDKNPNKTYLLRGTIAHGGVALAIERILILFYSHCATLSSERTRNNRNKILP